MEITEVRVRLVNGGAERLRAFCSVTLDGDFVIRDLKVIEGTNGYFVAMPSRKLAYRCGRCGNKNHLRAKFCNECGGKLSERRAPRDQQGRSKLHVDVAHPINTACRERIQQSVIEAFNAEMEKAQQPDYQPAAAGDDEDMEGGSEYTELVAELKETAAKRHEERRGGRPAEPRIFEPDDAMPDDDDDADGDVDEEVEELEEIEMTEEEEDDLDEEGVDQTAMGSAPRGNGNREGPRGAAGQRDSTGRGQRDQGNRRDQGPPRDQGQRRDQRGPRDGNRDSRGPQRQERGDRRPAERAAPPPAREAEVEREQPRAWTPPAPPVAAPPPPPAPPAQVAPKPPVVRREEPADGGSDFAAGLLD